MVGRRASTCSTAVLAGQAESPAQLATGATLVAKRWFVSNFREIKLCKANMGQTAHGCWEKRS
jgi:hypothetical protein